MAEATSEVCIPHWNDLLFEHDCLTPYYLKFSKYLCLQYSCWEVLFLVEEISRSLFCSLGMVLKHLFLAVAVSAGTHVLQKKKIIIHNDCSTCTLFCMDLFAVSLMAFLILSWLFFTVVLSSLRHLSTSTSILSDPSRLPEQATEAVSKMNKTAGET